MNPCEICARPTDSHRIGHTYVCHSCWETDDADQLMDEMNVVSHERAIEIHESVETLEEHRIRLSGDEHVVRKATPKQVECLFGFSNGNPEPTPFSTINWTEDERVYVSIVSNQVGDAVDMTLNVSPNIDEIKSLIAETVSQTPAPSIVTDGAGPTVSLDENEISPEDKYIRVDGSPRYYHKTTKLIKWADAFSNQTLFVAAQHQLAEEVTKNHLGDTEYGIDASRIVWVQGKERSCPNCTHEIDGSNWYKVEQAARNALEQHRVVKPEVFSDVCPYAATKVAAEYADWVVTVPQMIDRINETFDDWTVIVDEESTQMSFFPKSAKVLEVKRTPSDLMPQDAMITEDSLGGSALDTIIDSIQAKIDTLERVPKRYRNALRAAQALQIWHQELVNEVSFDSMEDTIESIQNHELPEVEPEGSNDEITKTFEYLRKNFGRYSIEPALEAMLASPKVHIEQSQSTWNVYLIPDTQSEILIQEKTFQNAERVGVVGASIAEYFLSHFTNVPDVREVEQERVLTQNLSIAAVEGDEMERRSMMTKVSRELTTNGIHNLLICGSGTRAAQAHENIGPQSYFFRGEATLDEYKVPADGDWSVVSYMGSRLTRGVDVNTQVTIVRSAQFASPRWHYYDDDWHEAIRDYENLIETHNAMLRGAGQGEEHVAIVPTISSLFFELDRYVEAFDVESFDDLIGFILDALDIVANDLVCETCEVEFVSEQGYMDHVCDDQQTPD